LVNIRKTGLMTEIGIIVPTMEQRLSQVLFLQKGS
jgi:hypothetical protein